MLQFDGHSPSDDYPSTMQTKSVNILEILVTAVIVNLFRYISRTLPLEYHQWADSDGDVAQQPSGSEVPNGLGGLTLNDITASHTTLYRKKQLAVVSMLQPLEFSSNVVDVICLWLPAHTELALHSTLITKLLFSCVCIWTNYTHYWTTISTKLAVVTHSIPRRVSISYAGDCSSELYDISL